jgi:hypothetical protein
MPEPSAQQFLFQHLKDNLPAHLSLVDSVAEVLHLSTDSTYRRIRGETPVSLDELKTLCTHFKVSLDHLFHLDKNATLFEVVNIDNETYPFESYLDGILRQLTHIDSFGQKEIYYASKDLPLHSFFHIPELLAFKHFFWMKTILNHPRFTNMVFQLQVEKHIADLAAGILQLYNQLPTAEIWNIECVNSTIQQIEFYKDAKVFNCAADMVTLYDCMEAMIDHLQKQAEYGTKFVRGENPELKAPNFRLFSNQVVLANNTLLICTGTSSLAIINYGILNYMATRDRSFCEFTRNELHNIIRRSTLISSVSEIQRARFFDSFRKKIDSHRKNI